MKSQLVDQRRATAKAEQHAVDASAKVASADSRARADGSVVVEIFASDKAFEAERCGRSRGSGEVGLATRRPGGEPVTERG